MVDYYGVLEVPRGASTAGIRKAYRKLALKWHPDKNQDKQEEANKRFKEISEAYQVLSDEKERRVYDQYGEEDLIKPETRSRSRHEDDFVRGFGFHNFRDPEDVFREFFMAFMASLSRRSYRSKRRRSPGRRRRRRKRSCSRSTRRRMSGSRRRRRRSSSRQKGRSRRRISRRRSKCRKRRRLQLARLVAPVVISVMAPAVTFFLIKAISN